MENAHPVSQKSQGNPGLRIGLLIFCMALFGALVVFWQQTQQSPIPMANPQGETVVFIVLDNVRADRLSTCGYDKPTSPFMENLCKEFSCNCRAYSPGSWTMPSHASFFTGMPVEDHGAGVTTDESQGVKLAIGAVVTGLAQEIPTLAEKMKAAGYQTVALSANPVLAEDTGILRGFDLVDVAFSFGAYFDDGFQDAFVQLMQKVDPKKPLFLFVNIADAHDQWTAIPESVDWLEPQPKLTLNPFRTKKHYKAELIQGLLTPHEKERFLGHLNQVYDYAIHRADRNLKFTLDALERANWFRAGRRIVITSDHGELLGEHDLIGHGSPLLYEGLVNVPLFVYPPNLLPEPKLPQSSIDAFQLVQGLIERRPVYSSSYKNPQFFKDSAGKSGGHHGIALWEGDNKTLAIDDRILRFDLSVDLQELKPSEAVPSEELAQISAIREKLDYQSVKAASQNNEEMMERLKALGYFE